MPNFILLCSICAEFSYTYNSTQNITQKGGGRSAYRAPTTGMVTAGNVVQSHKSRLTPGGKAVRSWKSVDRGEKTHISGVHYKQAHNEESNEYSR